MFKFCIDRDAQFKESYSLIDSPSFLATMGLFPWPRSSNSNLPGPSQEFS